MHTIGESGGDVVRLTIVPAIVPLLQGWTKENCLPDVNHIWFEFVNERGPGAVDSTGAFWFRGGQGCSRKECHCGWDRGRRANSRTVRDSDELDAT
jgi:hypothetical protein